MDPRTRLRSQQVEVCRMFEPSRLAATQLAAAYELVVPRIRRPLALRQPQVPSRQERRPLEGGGQS